MSAHGGKRLPQKASGYRRTVVAGVTTNLDGELTGALPGKLRQSGSLNAALGLERKTPRAASSSLTSSSAE